MPKVDKELQVDVEVDTIFKLHLLCAPVMFPSLDFPHNLQDWICISICKPLEYRQEFVMDVLFLANP